MMLRLLWALKCILGLSKDRRGHEEPPCIERRVPKTKRRMDHADEVLATAIMELSEALKEKQK